MQRKWGTTVGRGKEIESGEGIGGRAADKEGKRKCDFRISSFEFGLW